MGIRSVLIAFYLSFASLAILSLFFGETGFLAIEKLGDRNLALSKNLSELEQRQEALKNTLSALRSDPEAIVLEARALGLYRRDDGVIYFRNIETSRSQPDAGQVLRLSPVKRMDEAFLRVIALVVGILAILVSLLAGRMKDADRAQ